MSILSKILWYLIVGVIVSILDILNEKRKNSQAYQNIIVGIGDQGGGVVFVFIFMISALWPVTLFMDLYRGFRS